MKKEIMKNLLKKGLLDLSGTAIALTGIELSLCSIMNKGMSGIYLFSCCAAGMVLLAIGGKILEQNK